MSRLSIPKVFGKQLLEEIPSFVNEPFLLVTMEDLYPIIAPKLEGAEYHTYFVKDTEEKTLVSDLKSLSEFSVVIGFGGGQALDVTKYFSWKKQVSFFQFPSILSVDAMFGVRSAIRRNGNVHYVGWALPECVFFDYDIIEAAPLELNISGVGDILCFYTAILDWNYATETQKSNKWPFRKELADISMEKFENLMKNKDDVKTMTEKGIVTIVDAFQWGGESYLGSGWCPCHVEGSEHFFFYTLECLTGKKFLHGLPVSLGVYIATLLHDQRTRNDRLDNKIRTSEILKFIVDIGLDIRPEAMGLTWKDIENALQFMKEYVREQGLWHSIVHDATITDEFVSILKEDIINAYK